MKFRPCYHNDCKTLLKLQGPVVQKVDNAIHWTNLYSVDNAIDLTHTCPLDSDLLGEQCYPPFEQVPEPDLI